MEYPMFKLDTFSLVSIYLEQHTGKFQDVTPGWRCNVQMCTDKKLRYRVKFQKFWPGHISQQTGSQCYRSNRLFLFREYTRKTCHYIYSGFSRVFALPSTNPHCFSRSISRSDNFTPESRKDEAASLKLYRPYTQDERCKISSMRTVMNYVLCKRATRQTSSPRFFNLRTR